MIEIRNLAKTYHGAEGDFTAVKNINLTINDGDIFGIIGLSGAGKSTLVRCINLLEVPTEGDVLVDGRSMLSLSRRELLAARQKIGMIFQGFNLLSQRTALDNITYPLEIAGVKRAQAVKRARELLDMVGLAEKEKSYPSQLSGGQKQRVAIARALATEPHVLLCDEATSALDPQTTKAILQLLKHLNETLGITVVIITHEMAVIRQICTHVAILDGGVIAEEGSVDDVFTHTRSEAGKRLFGIVASENHEQVQEKPAIRIVFNGETIAEPIVADLILHLGVPLSIRSADVHTLNGAQYGQLLISRPDDPMVCHRAIEYLKERGLTVEEVRA